MKEYFEKEALNYSTLSALDTNYPGNVFKERTERESTPAMSRGSLVDCLLTSPKEFNELFVIAESTTLTPLIKKVIDNIDIDLLNTLDKDKVIQSAKELSLGGGKWTDTTILKKAFTDDTKKYYEERKVSTSKIQITLEDYTKAQAVVEVIKTHEFTSWIFNPVDGVEVFYQLPLYWKENGVECKALLDILVIDNNNKIIRPIDLKIKADSKYAFKTSFMRYKYYLQAAWYTKGLNAKLHPKYENYTIENFTFLVTTFDYPEPPLLYRCSDSLLYTAVFGNSEIKGINQLFNDYKWYVKNQLFSYPKELHLNKGVIELNL